ncbi:hypothetical protein EVAR_28020_1 [Eumeta japonica]|uniref:Uncharacterized protein n=1 Tax=Eumeta variegata TaxID=151549 RepID=A0A4C1WEM0_EUMVA|nr:hypothetical protein EVAR_28020_1 [Eumeta japonica]
MKKPSAWWDINNDALGFNLGLRNTPTEVLETSLPPTKRQVTSAVMSAIHRSSLARPHHGQMHAPGHMEIRDRLGRNNRSRCIILSWIRSDPRSFKPFVAHRLAELEEHDGEMLEVGAYEIERR